MAKQDLCKSTDTIFTGGQTEWECALDPQRAGKTWCQAGCCCVYFLYRLELTRFAFFSPREVCFTLVPHATIWPCPN